MIASLGFCLVTYLMTGQINDHPWRLGYILLIIGLTSIVSEDHGMMMGAIFMENPESANYLGGMTMMPLVVFSGFFRKLPLIPWFLQGFSYISYIRYGLSAVLIVMYGIGRCEYEHHKIEIELGANFSLVRPKWMETISYLVEQQGLGPTVAEGDEEVVSDPDSIVMSFFGGKKMAQMGNITTSLILDQFDIIGEESYMWSNIHILIGFIISFRIITYLVLLYKVRKE
jgi:hypothetical protein